jgi:tetratricopeptide (TPR) repeat protein
LLAVAPLAAQDWKGVGRMEGRVLDPDGKPLPDAVVKLELPARGGGTTIKTDKKGRWALGGIAAGQWNIDVEAAGFEPKRISVNLPSQETRLPPVEMKLEKAVPKGPPPEVVAAIKAGDEHFKAGRYAEARAEYEKLLANSKLLNPEGLTIIHKQIAFCYSREKNYEKEMEHLQIILDADPENVDIKTLMASEAIEAGMLDKGLEILKTMDEATIKNPDVFYNIGVSFRNRNRPDDALAYFTKAVTLDPTYADGYFQRGLTYFGLQKTAEAKADFKKVIELAPDGPQADTAKKALEQLK